MEDTLATARRLLGGGDGSVSFPSSPSRPGVMGTAAGPATPNRAATTLSVVNSILQDVSFDPAPYALQTDASSIQNRNAAAAADSAGARVDVDRAVASAAALTGMSVKDLLTPRAAQRHDGVLDDKENRHGRVMPPLPKLSSDDDPLLRAAEAAFGVAL